MTDRLLYSPGDAAALLSISTQTLMTDRLLYSPGDAAALLSISTQTLRGLVARGDLVAIKLGGSTRYAHDDLVAYVARLRRAS